MKIKEDKVEAINDKSHHFQEILEKVPRWIIRHGNTFFLILFLFLLIGIRFIQYPDVITSEIMVLTENPSIEVHSLATGKIINVLKSDGDSVKKDEWVLILQNNADYRSIITLSEILNELESKFFWEMIDTIQFKDRFFLGEINSDYVQFTRSIGEYRLFLKLNPQFQQIEINNSRNGNLEEISKTLANQQQILKREQELVKVDLERSQTLFKKGVISKKDLEIKEIEYLTVKNRIEELNATKFNSQLQKENIRKENSILIIEQSNQYFEMRNNVLNNYNNLLFLVQKWKQKNVLTSPIDGTLNFYDIRNNYQFLTEDQKVFTVTPNGKYKYYGFAKMPINNSGKVKIGQEVIIKLNNYPYHEFGILKGIIMSITNVPQGGIYLLKINLPNQLKTNSNKELEGKYELVGTAEIITEDISLFDRMFYFVRNSNNY
ncbi:MAG: hypothetical protein CVU08_09650 [Bacteroidetes bacterium HGW-Bacteroidetes-3]|nr:MAG: hypothetical protein CVU08_09650 [Bacteroidetes bacterium HGW-Bacteroidetes-3]